MRSPVRGIQYSRAILLVLFLTVAPKLYADYGWMYYFKCKVATPDTTITGFIRAPYEYISDSTLARFKKDRKFFKSKFLTDVKNYWSTSTVKITDFAYVYTFSVDKAIYESNNFVNIEIGNIKSVELLKVIAFHVEANTVVSVITPQDTIWCKREPLKRIDDKEIDGCCPEVFLIYDEKVRYQEIINKIIAESNMEKRTGLMKGLRKYKIVAVRMCWCG